MTEADETDVIPRELHHFPGAAICSAELVDRIPGLVIAQKGVQDVQGEFQTNLSETC